MYKAVKKGELIMDQTKIGLKVSITTIIVNSILAIFKLFAGLIGKSNAMISDSVHSFSDVFSTIIVIIGLKASSKVADKEHPYGHERMESIAAFILAAVLFATGLLIGVKGIQNIFFSNNIEIPTILALIGAIISIVIKELMYWYTIINAKKIKSEALKADAWHHRSDALSSIGSLIGIGGAMLGITILDSVASLVICALILKVSYDIFIDSLNKVVDRACSEDTIAEIKQLALEINGVLDVDLIKTRMFGNKIYIDLEISAAKDLSLEKAHSIAHQVHDAIESKLKDVKHCMVHVNPSI